MPKGPRKRSETELQEVSAFQQRLEQLIAVRQTTPAGLARQSGTTPRTIYRILDPEIGAEPGRTLLVAMARALGVSVDTLAAGGSQGADIDRGYLVLVRKALEMTFGASLVAAMASDERDALIQRVAEVLSTLYGSAVPPMNPNLATVTAARYAILALIDDAAYHNLVGPRGEEMQELLQELPLIQRAALSLEQLMFISETTKSKTSGNT